MSKQTPTTFQHGYDCGLNGPNETNSHFSIFSSAVKTKAWEQGKKAGERAKNNPKEKKQPYEHEQTAADDYLDYLSDQW